MSTIAVDPDVKESLKELRLTENEMKLSEIEDWIVKHITKK